MLDIEQIHHKCPLEQEISNMLDIEQIHDTCPLEQTGGKQYVRYRTNT